MFFGPLFMFFKYFILPKILWFIFNLIVFIIICFLSPRITKLLKTNHWILNSFAWIANLLIIALFYIPIYNLSIIIWQHYPDMPFNQKVWVSETYERYMMNAKLIEDKVLIGKTTQEVEQLLGKEDREKQRNVRWIYSTGYLPGPFTFLPHVIDIEFEADTVVRVTEYDDRH